MKSYGLRNKQKLNLVWEELHEPRTEMKVKTTSVCMYLQYSVTEKNKTEIPYAKATVQ